MVMTGNKIEKASTLTQALTRVPKKVLQKEDFIKLFITQLQYQDPMKPLETNDMAIQLAMFNQVDQLFNINDTLKHLVELNKNLNFVYVSSLVGKKVKVETNLGRIENGVFLGGEIKLDNPVNSLEIVIRDPNGKIVRRLNLVGLSKGVHKIDWDGRDESGNALPDGNYTFSVIIPDGTPFKTITPTMIAKITGAKLGSENKIVINDHKEIYLTEIKEIIGG